MAGMSDDWKVLVSYLLHAVAWIAVLATLYVTSGFVYIWDEVATTGMVNGWTGLGFAITTVPIVCGIFLIAVVPSSVLYWYTKRKRDRLSLWLSGGSFLVVVVEIVAFRGFHQGGGC
jgi:hypothetical protein